MEVENIESHQQSLTNTMKMPLQETSPNILPPTSVPTLSPIKLINNRKRGPTTPIKPALMVNTRRKLQELPPTSSQVNVHAQIQQKFTAMNESAYTKLHSVEIGDYTMYGNTPQEIESNYQNYLLQYKVKYLQDVNEFLKIERESRNS